ncbi:MAG TPA: hypothetical protein PKJ41_02395 [Bryobacteraceae bacterium]|nr:hypothetical protein [Bryobacteraceae bacterium]HPT25379.1 hypothetical protein [Bryobacteraceae bacterium]
MANTPSEERSGSDSPHGPTAILANGKFDARSSAGRRYRLRSGLALAAFVIWWMFGSDLLRPLVSRGILDPISALAPGVAFSYMAWEFRKYLAAMDELERRIHMESITWTYLSGFAIAMLIAGLSHVYGWRVNPGLFLLLEPVRAGWLYFVSRRYQ